jgi:hypothetical protein
MNRRTSIIFIIVVIVDALACKRERRLPATPATGSAAFPAKTSELTGRKTEAEQAGAPTERRSLIRSIAPEARARLQRYGQSVDTYYRAAGAPRRPLAGALARCADASPCLSEGKCAGYVGGLCETASTESCRSADPCLIEALCSYSEGRCTLTPQECSRSAACKHGQCTAKGEVCAAVVTADCKGSEICRESGMCTPKDNLCLATTDLDCRTSRHCGVKGRCTARDGECVALADRDCAGCARYGRCVVSNGECVALSDSHCAQSKECANRGACRAMNGACWDDAMIEVYRSAEPTSTEDEGLVDLSLPAGQVPAARPTP